MGSINIPSTPYVPNAPFLSRNAATNAQLVAGNTGSYVNVTGGTFNQAFAASVALGTGWFCIYTNRGSGIVTLTPNGAETINSAASLALPPKTSYFLESDGANLFATLHDDVGYLHVRDEKPSGTNGGSSIAGTQIRTLNATLTNTIAGASLVSDIVTLPAGTYRVFATAPCGENTAAQITHKARLYNITAAASVIIGTSEAVGAAIGPVSRSIITGQFTLAVTSALRIDHYTSVVSPNVGLGVPAASGDIEVFTEVEIWRPA